MDLIYYTIQTVQQKVVRPIMIVLKTINLSHIVEEAILMNINEFIVKLDLYKK